MANKTQSKTTKSKRGGWRPGAGRKRKLILRTQFLSARTTLEVKRAIEDVCIEDQITESDYIHRVILKDLRERGVKI